MTELDMTKESNNYDKMTDYIVSLFNVFQMVNLKAETQNDKRFKLIGLTIFNYVRKMANDYDVDLKNITQPECINLIPIFEYIAYNNIELYDFSKIDITDVDTSNKKDLEKFILTHVYYITQKK
jgi:UV DNA damage repair endonuclease